MKKREQVALRRKHLLEDMLVLKDGWIFPWEIDCMEYSGTLHDDLIALVRQGLLDRKRESRRAKWQYRINEKGKKAISHE